jgi:NAD(P)-dependent dehydrogenase (short-subunit alcohol dehydrogenase family)
VAGGKLDGRVALITGASRGIGRSIAKRFAREGAHLILSARTQGALEELDDEIRSLGGHATLVPADLTDYAKIDEMGAAVFQRYGRLDILVGNAAMLGILSPLGHIDPALWEQTVALNLTANWRLIRSFDPLLRQSDAGRALFLTSGAARGAVPYWGVYATSKAALETMVKIYAAEVAKTAIRVNLVDPGAIRTGMRAEAFPGENPMTLKAPDKIAQVFVDLSSPAETRNGQVISAS